MWECPKKKLLKWLDIEIINKFKGILSGIIQNKTQREKT